MSDPTRSRRDLPRRHAGDRMPTPPGAHPAETVITRFGHEPGRTPEDSIWRGYEDDLYYADAGFDDEFDEEFEEMFDDEDDRGRFGDVREAVIHQGRSAGAGLLETARRNPVGTALTAAGIALLFAPRIESEDARAAARRARARAESAAYRGRARARAELAPYERRMRRGFDEARERAAEGARRPSKALARRFDTLRDRIEAGTEHMSEEARSRVVAARMRAIEARDRFLDASERVRGRTEHALRDGAENARETYREHPLLVGGLAVVLGAAIGAALPRTRFEDSRLGDLSERLMEEAEEIYRRERAALAGAARGAMNEAREMASETAEAARENIPDGEQAAREAEHRLREGAARVAEGARSGVRRETGG